MSSEHYANDNSLPARISRMPLSELLKLGVFRCTRCASIHVATPGIVEFLEISCDSGNPECGGELIALTHDQQHNWALDTWKKNEFPGGRSGLCDEPEQGPLDLTS